MIRFAQNASCMKSGAFLLRIAVACLAFAAGIVTPAHADGVRWNGCYLGAHLGYGQALSRHVATGLFNGITPTPWTSWNGIAVPPIPEGTDLAGGAIRSAGPLTGGQLGCTWQRGSLAAGFELDLAGASMNGERATLGPIPVSQPATAYHATNPRALGTFRLRAGYEQGNWLLYVTAGGAWSLVGIRSRTDPFFMSPRPVVNNNKETLGGVFGFGAEYAIDARLSVKLEALYLHFAPIRAISRNLGPPPWFNPVCYCYERRASLSAAVLRVGLNYKFAAW
jgi:outer membrane immunogenic protein